MEFDVCVIGAGPGGYVAAIRAAQLGKKTVIVERESLGGVCLNVGCIPSKALIVASHFYSRMQHDAAVMGFEIKAPVKINAEKLQSWKQSVVEKMTGGIAQLLKANGVTVIAGEAQFTTPTQLEVKTTVSHSTPAKTEIIKAKNYIVATGSRPIEIPGFKIDETQVLSSSGALALKKLPKKIIVVGGGYIGLEIGTLMAKLGVEIEVVEAGNQLLSGVADPDCVQVVTKNLNKLGVKIHYNAKAVEYKKTSNGLEVSIQINNQVQKISGEKILLTVGRRPNSDGLNLKNIGVQLDEKGFVKVNPQRKTNLQGIYAIGDIACQPMLAHKASYEGILAAEVIAGKNRVYDPKTVPAVIFVDPEIASAGWTEAECKLHGHTDLKVGKFPFAANGRAVSLMETNGLVKIIADAKTNIVLGVHIAGPEASQLISEAVLGIEMGARLEDLAGSIHPHPTLSETLMEAAEATLGHAIHIYQKPRSHA
ncbi:MAG: dihydrolipoyl dehydrogenase [Bdellovibrionales bacterium]|nr:dihydrolipoyl dehydrogenase [Bdellovibrionales bacterium]